MRRTVTWSSLHLPNIWINFHFRSDILTNSLIAVDDTNQAQAVRRMTYAHLANGAVSMVIPMDMTPSAHAIHTSQLDTSLELITQQIKSTGHSNLNMETSDM